MKRRGLIAGLAIGGIAVAGACWFTRGASADVPTAKVERGSFVDAVQIRGEIKAGRSVTIIAPSDAGELRIVKLARSGTVVKKGDALIEFDGSTVSRTVEEKQSELRGFEAEMERARSESRSKQEENVTAETKATYDVERAKLDYSAKEILPRVDAEQRRLKVGDAQQNLRVASSKLSSDKVAGNAKESGIETKRTKSEFDLNKANRQLNSLTVSAPSDGIVTILRNWRSGNWMNPQDFKEGDRVWAGASIAELPDISSMFGSARVDEVERGRMAIGQAGTIRVEALPDRELKGHVDKISALAKADFTTWPPPRNFDLTMAIDDPRRSAAARHDGDDSRGGGDALQRADGPSTSDVLGRRRRLSSTSCSHGRAEHRRRRNRSPERRSRSDQVGAAGGRVGGTERSDRLEGHR